MRSIFLFICLLFCGTLSAQNFITKWDLSKAGSNATSISFNYAGSSPGSTYTWQELSPGSSSGSGTLANGNGPRTISGLPAGATIRLQIEPSRLQRFYLSGGADTGRLIDIEAWGNAAWTSMQNAFFGCSSLNSSATDMPNLGAVQDMSNMFRDCASLTGPANINSWNISADTTLANTFRGATNFNRNLSSWNTGAVRNMSHTFLDAMSFNQNISSWNTGSVNNMQGMFYGAAAFNQPIGSWNTAAVTNMSSMFRNATAFNQNIGAWNTGSVTSISFIFQGAANFNQAIGSWNTSAVADMNSAFQNAASFNQPLNSWNISNATNMLQMFQGALLFNHPLGSWNTAAVTNMSGMFRGAKAFNQPLAAWNTANVADMSYMFSATSRFNQNIGAWILNPNVDLTGTLSNCGLNTLNYSAILKGWHDNNPTVMGRTLGANGRYYTLAVGNAERNTLVTTRGWTISGDHPNNVFVTLWDLSQAGGGANDQISFNVKTSAAGPATYIWKDTAAGGLTGSASIGANANGTRTITGLPVGKVIRLEINSDNLQQFNINNGVNRLRLIDVESWGTTSWTGMQNAFYGCSNLDISGSDVPDLSLVSDMGNMFRNCSSLRGIPGVNGWVTTTINNLSGLLNGATLFNEDISSWNTGAVTNFSNCFTNATTFNQDIGSWNTVAGTDLSNMFNGATGFNKNLGMWTLNPSVNLAGMMNSCGMDCTHYGATLAGWSANNPTVTGRTLGASGLRYGESALNDRTTLVSGRGWTITGDAVSGGSATLVPSGNTVIPTLASCSNLAYINPANPSSKMLQLDPNGNTGFAPASVVVNNNDIGTLPPGVTSTNGYYQMSDANGTMRISNQLVTIVAPGTYAANSGVRVRIYYDPSVLSAMTGDAFPVGSLQADGWFKVSIDNASGTAGAMTSSHLAGGNTITPVASGTENGVAYVEFLTETFSTFGYYAKTSQFPLPVTLVSFRAGYSDCAALIDWESGVERNLSHYEVESGVDGYHFSSLGTVISTGSGSRYNFRASVHDNKVHFFRLKCVDLDGTVQYSNIVHIAGKCNGLNTIQAGPNPVHDKLLLSIPEQIGVWNGQLRAADGSVVEHYKNQAPGNKVIDVAALVDGVYFISVQSALGQSFTCKIVKQ